MLWSLAFAYCCTIDAALEADWSKSLHALLLEKSSITMSRSY